MLCLAETLQLRESSTSIQQAGSSEQSTSAEEAKLSHAQSTAEDKHNVPPLGTMEPGQSTESLTAHEKQIVVKMCKRNHSKLRIAQFLGRDLQVVHNTLYQLGSGTPMRTTYSRFRLSDSEWDDIEKMRREGLSWEDIQRRKFDVIDIGRTALARSFRHQMTKKRKPLPPNLNAPKILSLSPTDLQDIAELRKAGKTWLQIARGHLKFKGHQAARRVQSTYSKLTSPDWRPPLELTSAVLRHMTELRQTEGYSFTELTQRHYPEWTTRNLMRKWAEKNDRG